MNENDFFPIRINCILPDFPCPFNLYLNLNNKFVLYLNAEDKINQEKLQKLDQYESDFYIQIIERESYKKYIQSLLEDEHLEPAKKAVVLRASSYAMVSELFENPDVHQALNQSKETIEQFVGFIDNEPDGVPHLISLSCHDFYTYNHSLDVGVYAIGLGKLLGFSKNELFELGQGALYHDIGKRFVSADIITKDGPLDDIEWAQMQKHPIFGLKILNDHSKSSSGFVVSEAVKASCFEHHENFLGTGYPQQLQGNEIHPHARIIAITDTFDAMTTQRSYNKAKTPTEALTFMKEKLITRYDAEFLKAFYSVLF